MSRYILRYQGSENKPLAAVETIRAIPDLSVIDESPRMLLVEAPLKILQEVLPSLPDWCLTRERMFEIPDPRPKISAPIPIEASALRKE